MYLGKVIGTVVATRKDDSMNGRKLLLVRPMLVDAKKPDTFVPGSNTIVAIDTVGAGEGELVMFAQGSSARQAEGLKSVPVDAAIVGLVDQVRVEGKTTFTSSSADASA